MKIYLLFLSLFLSCFRCFAINVAYVCNDEYVHVLAASVESMLSNKSQADEISIFVLHCDFTDKTILRLTTLVKNRANIEFVRFDKGELKDVPDTSEIMHIMMYAKNLIFDKLSYLDKVLYMDVDTIILSSLDELYKTDLGDNYAAVVQDQLYFSNAEAYGGLYDNVKGWFNSGVMLLNMRKCVKEKIFPKFLYQMKNVKHFFGDQPIFNYLFGKKIIYIRPKWNATSVIFVQPNYRHPALIYSEAEFNEAMKSPAIVHLSGRGYVNARHPRHVDFFLYLRKTPWRGLERRLLVEMHLRSIVGTDLWDILKIKYF